MNATQSRIVAAVSMNKGRREERMPVCRIMKASKYRNIGARSKPLYKAFAKTRFLLRPFERARHFVRTTAGFAENGVHGYEE